MVTYIPAECDSVWCNGGGWQSDDQTEWGNIRGAGREEGRKEEEKMLPLLCYIVARS